MIFIFTKKVFGLELANPLKSPSKDLSVCFRVLDQILFPDNYLLKTLLNLEFVHHYENVRFFCSEQVLIVEYDEYTHIDRFIYGPKFFPLSSANIFV